MKDKKHKFGFFFHRCPFDYSCIQMYNILSMHQFYTTAFPLISGLRAVPLKLGDWNATVRQTSVATLQRIQVLCKISHLTEDDWKIHVNTGMVELHNALKLEGSTTVIKDFFFFFGTPSISHAKYDMAPPTCGIRFFWIRFNLDFFLPFFVTTVSS